MVFGLKRKLPVAARPRLERDERVSAWASIVDRSASDAVVVTTHGLFLPGHERLGWHEIHKATWAGSRLTVVPAVRVSEGEQYTVLADGNLISVNLTDPDDVPAEVRERVTKSVAYTAHYPLPTGGVRIVARRTPGVNGLAWHVRYDEGTDTLDPDVIAFTAELIAEAARPVPD
jgi:hypothetical protein